MTPLDCFWEGATISSVGRKKDANATNVTNTDYKNTDPSRLVEIIKEGGVFMTEDKKYYDQMYREVKKFVDKV